MLKAGWNGARQQAWLGQRNLRKTCWKVHCFSDLPWYRSPSGKIQLMFYLVEISCSTRLLENGFARLGEGRNRIEKQAKKGIMFFVPRAIQTYLRVLFLCCRVRAHIYKHSIHFYSIGTGGKMLDKSVEYQMSSLSSFWFERFVGKRKQGGHCGQSTQRRQRQVWEDG